MGIVNFRVKYKIKIVENYYNKNLQLLIKLSMY